MVRITVEKPDREAETLTFESPAELTVGRGADCACRLKFDPMVSRMHAVLLIDPPSVRVKDLNSTNGLVINGELFGAANNQRLIQPLELRDGDEMYIGETRFTVAVLDTGLDLGTEFSRIKAEQEVAAVEVAGGRRERPGGKSMSGRIAAPGGKFETGAALAAVCPDIPGYRVERYLAEGLAGSVYKARAAESGVAVVLKTASPAGAFTGELAEEFRRGMEEARELSHLGLAELYAYGDAGQTLYTVSEFVNGETLASYLARCPRNRMPLGVSFDLLRQMAGALCYLHRNSIVHRDIHPGGIILYDDNGRLRMKLSEAGLARFWMESGLGARAMPGGEGLAERLGYLAPEELVQRSEAKASGDVFSLACVFYRMISGRVPYEFGGGKSALRVVEEGRIRPIEDVMPGLPETVAVSVDRALSPDPEARYQSACEVLDALESISL